MKRPPLVGGGQGRTPGQVRRDGEGMLLLLIAALAFFAAYCTHASI